MNLDDVTYFLTIAETGLLHRAATQVGVSQPALTKAVRRLETELGVTLFELSPKGMQLTRFGTEFQRHASTLRAAYEDALNQIGELSAGELAKVRLGATPAIEPLVGRAFLALLAQRPALRLDLKVQLSDTLIQSLVEGDIDVAVGPMPTAMPEGVKAVPLSDESTSIVCRAGHPLLQDIFPHAKPADEADRESVMVEPEALAQFPWILPGEGVLARQRIDAYFEEWGIGSPRVQVQNNYYSPVDVYFIVANTDMLGICSMQHRPVAAQLGLQTILARHSNWSRKIAVFTRRNGSLSPLTQTFVATLLEKSVAL